MSLCPTCGAEHPFTVGIPGGLNYDLDLLAGEGTYLSIASDGQTTGSVTFTEISSTLPSNDESH